MKQMIAVSSLAFVLAAGLSVGIFASKSSPSLKTSNKSSCDASVEKSSSMAAAQAKDGKSCDKKDKECDWTSKKTASGKKECDKNNEEKVSSSSECENKTASKPTQ